MQMSGQREDSTRSADARAGCSQLLTQQQQQQQQRKQSQLQSKRVPVASGQPSQESQRAARRPTRCCRKCSNANCLQVVVVFAPTRMRKRRRRATAAAEPFVGCRWRGLEASVAPAGPSRSISAPVAAPASLFLLVLVLFISTTTTTIEIEAQFIPPQQYGNLSVSQAGGFRLPPQVRMDYYDNPQLIQDRRSLMYPYDARYLSDISSGKPIHDQPLQFRLPYFGFSYEYIWIQRDGYISFNKGLQTYRFPLQLPIQPQDTFIQEDPSMVAPFFAMQDISSETPNAGVYFQIVNLADTMTYSDPEYGLLRDRLLLDFRDGMIGASDFVPKWAMIVTWCNMTIANRRQERPLKTNTYQAVLATDEIRTYAMFNYEQIEWITHLDNYDGLKGPAAFVGFNAGNTTRSFEFKPYSQHQRVSMLPSGGFGNNLRGRYYYQVDEEVWPGACIDKKLEPNLRDRLPLTFFPRYGHMLGGTLVDVTGPCLDPNSIIFCRFDNFKAEAVWRDTNRATCVSPPFMYHGYVDLTISVDERIEFVGRFYVQPPDVADEDVVIIDAQDRQEAPSELELKWRPQKLSWRNDTSVTISLWGYRETMNVYPQLTYITTLVPSVRLGQSQFRMDLSMFRERDDYDNQDIMFGFIAINLTSPAVALGARNMRQSPVIWSRPMPLAWYFRPQWLRTLGAGYKDQFCANWFERESFADRFAATVWRCPCTYQQAKVDRGRFSPDLQCNIIDRRCDTFHREALHCVNTGRPSVGGSGQTCCYDDQGELIQTADTIFGGRPTRAFPYGKHPFKIRMMIPTLSTWVHDVAPYFYCCLWQRKKDNAEACQNYNHFRTSQDCSLYQAPVVGSVYGDPHLITFNKNNYTFNGRGEYVLVHADDPKVKFDVQARFEQVPRRLRNYPNIQATQLTAVAAQDNFSSIVEFRIRPLAARWRYHIYVLVDNEYIYWWDKSMQVQNFRGVTLYQPAGIQNMSHIIAMFDSGAGIEVMSIDGFMTTHVYLPADFQGITGGLLGNYSRRGQQIDDLITPAGMRFGPRTPIDRLHREFGQQWRLTEQPRLGVGKTILSHSAVRYAMYDDPRFEPVLQMPPMLPYELGYLQPELDSICSDSLSCIYDYVVSFGNKELALATKKFEAIAYEIANVASQLVVRCPALPKPANGMKSENRYWPGQVVRFSCDVGYRLVGYEARYCREDGLWSWGEDPQCIPEWRYFLIMFGSIMTAFLPMAITIAAGIFCLLFMVRRSRSHYTGETGESAANGTKQTLRQQFKRSTPRGAQSSSSLNKQQQQPGSSGRQLIRRGQADDDVDADEDDDQDQMSEDDLDENMGNFSERAPRATEEDLGDDDVDDDDDDDDDDDQVDQLNNRADDGVRRRARTLMGQRGQLPFGRQQQQQQQQQQQLSRPSFERRNLLPSGGLASVPIGSRRTLSSSVYEPTTQSNLDRFNSPTIYQPYNRRQQADEPGLPIIPPRPPPGSSSGAARQTRMGGSRAGPQEPDYGPIREARI